VVHPDGPPPETFAPVSAWKGQALRTDHVGVFARPLLAGCGAEPRAADRQGAAPAPAVAKHRSRILVFDVEPLPTVNVEALIKQSKKSP
jgi:hypothetical protein